MPLLLWGSSAPSRVSLQTFRGGATRGSQGGPESGHRRRGTPASCPMAATLLGTGSSARGRDPSAPPMGGPAKGAPPEAPSSWGFPSWGPTPPARVRAEAQPAWPPRALLRGEGGAPRGSQLLLVFAKMAGGWNVVLGGPGWRVTHFGSVETSFHLRRLQQRGGEVALSAEGCGFAARAAAVSAAGPLCSGVECGPASLEA